MTTVLGAGLVQKYNHFVNCTAVQLMTPTRPILAKLGNITCNINPKLYSPSRDYCPTPILYVEKITFLVKF